jgi:hypothetical protein
MLSLARNAQGSAVVDYIVHHRIVLGLVAIQSLCAIYVTQVMAAVPLGGVSSQLVQIVIVIPCAAYAVLAHRLFQLTFVDRVPDRMSILRSEISRFVTDVPTLVRGAATLMLLLFALSSFAHTKRLVAEWGSFSWDATFEEWDRVIFLGQVPWRVFYDLIGYHSVLTLLTGAYVFWLTVLLSTMTIAAFTRRNRQARMQFLIAHLLSWFLIGNVLATLFSSAGPVYYGRLGLGDVYEPLVAILDSHATTHPYSVRVLQETLWDLYTFPQGGFSVISAMPSMHVASMVVVTLYAFTAARWLGWMLAGLTLSIFIGSFMLAWHYFLDGVVATACVLIIWNVSGWIARRTVGATA